MIKQDQFKLIFQFIWLTFYSAQFLTNFLMCSFNKDTKIFKGEDVPPRFPVELHISEIILSSLRKTPDRVIQIYEENGSELTCDALRSSAIRVAQNLAKLGIKDGDVVGFDCSNSENICALITGCVFLGAVASPMAIEHVKEDIVHMWSMTRPKFVFCDAEVHDKVTEALNELKNDVIICTLIDRRAGVLFVDEILAPTGYEEDFEPIKCEKPYEKLIALLSSSGTTGPSKAVCVTQDMPFQWFNIFHSDGSKDARCVHFGSFFWVLPYTLFVVLSLTNMTRIVTRRTGSLENYLQLVEKFKIQLLFPTTAMINIFSTSPLTKSADLSSLQFLTCGGSITFPEIREAFKLTFPDKPLLTPYGSTEMMLSWSQKGDANDGYKVGRIKPNSQFKIVDDDGLAVNLGEQGEICAKSSFPFLVSNL